MIDLSFLTEEEQEIIQDVLKRDAELKKAEEQRIQCVMTTPQTGGGLVLTDSSHHHQLVNPPCAQEPAEDGE